MLSISSFFSQFASCSMQSTGTWSSQTPCHVLKHLMRCMSNSLPRLAKMSLGKDSFTCGCVRARGFGLYNGQVYPQLYVICTCFFNIVKCCHLQPFLLILFIWLLVYKVIVIIIGTHIWSQSCPLLRVLSISGQKQILKAKIQTPQTLTASLIRVSILPSKQLPCSVPSAQKDLHVRNMKDMSQKWVRLQVRLSLHSIVSLFVTPNKAA